MERLSVGSIAFFVAFSLIRRELAFHEAVRFSFT